MVFIVDIEAMLYQLRISLEQRSYVKFSWWKDSNTMKKAVDREMYTHVFVGTSSPPCSNSALRRTTAETKKLFGSGASDTLNRNI